MDPHIVILAAGQGKKMHSKLPKVLHPVLFRPMLHCVLDLAASISAQSISIVVGHDDDQVKRSCAGYPGLRFFRQDVQLGTGHAMRAVEPFLKLQQGDVLVLSGDVILLERASVRRMLERHVRERAACTIGTTTLTQPNGYGRILRHMDGRVAAVREDPDCSPAEKFINEVNAGVYVFRIDTLFDALARVTNENMQKEYYLPDAIRPLSGAGKLVLPYCFGDPQEVMGIDDRRGLAAAEDVLRSRVNRELMGRGVTLQDPATTWIDPRCRIGEDVRIEGGCVLVGSALEDEVTVESHCRVLDSVVGRGTRLKQGCYLEGSLVGSRCSVGPYAHLRPGSALERDVRIGNFVEVKKSVIGAGSKAAHLSYIGDAEVGRDVNIGCGFITCNFDGGPEKKKTVIEDGAFIGSDSQAVAPVRIGRGSYVASGTTVTEDVPPEALAISRGRQTNKAGYARRLRGRARRPPERVQA